MKRGLLVIALILGAVGAVTANGGGDEAVQEESSLEVEILRVPSIVVDGEWLASHLGDPNLVILDAGRNSDDYQSGRVDGALYADRTGYYAEVDGLPGMFPGVDTTVAWIESLGIGNDTAVVVYDGGAGLWAARVAWTLAYLGHENWAVLDGGWQTWDSIGYPVSSGSPTVASSVGQFVPNLRPELLVSGDQVLTALDEPSSVVVDTRSLEEFQGTDVRAERGGRIPGAVHIEWVLNNVDGGLPAYLPPVELQEFYQSLGVTEDKQVIAHCQTGVRGAHTWLALTLAGYENVALYDGSWVEWGNDDRFPVEGDS